MSDYGTPEERAAALRVALACKELNAAIESASAVGVNVRVIDLEKDLDEPSDLQVQRMERRTMILPTAPTAAEDAA